MQPSIALLLWLSYCCTLDRITFVTTPRNRKISPFSPPPSPFLAEENEQNKSKPHKIPSGNRTGDAPPTRTFSRDRLASSFTGMNQVSSIEENPRDRSDPIQSNQI